MHRRDILLQGALAPIMAALGPGARAQDAMPFDNATVRNLARDLAQHAWQAPDASLPRSVFRSRSPLRLPREFPQWTNLPAVCRAVA